MPIQLQCPNCQKNYQVDDQMSGKRVKCKCGQAITIPAAQPQPDQLELVAEDPLAADPLAGGDPLAAPLPGGQPLPGPASAQPTLKTRAKPDAEAAPAKKKKKKAGDKKQKQTMIFAVVLGLFAVGMVTGAVMMVGSMNRPGKESPEKVYSTYQAALRDKKWDKQFEMVAPDSQQSMLEQLITTAEGMEQAKPNTSGEITAMFRKYGRNKDSSDWWHSLKKKPTFYKDLIGAIEKSEENTWPINGTVRTMMRKGIGTARRDKASAKLVELEVDGDTASGERLRVVDGDEWREPMAFRKVKPRWFVDIDEVPRMSALGMPGMGIGTF